LNPESFDDVAFHFTAKRAAAAGKLKTQVLLFCCDRGSMPPDFGRPPVWPLFNGQQPVNLWAEMALGHPDAAKIGSCC
jgi:hypothetical protein